TGTPQGAAADPALDSAPLGPVTIETGEERWTGWVADRPTGRIVAVYDMSRHSAEEHRLVVAVSAAGLLGILLAALIGWLVARRAVRPLGDALARQRRFVADASHELRTPLAVVNTRAQLLRMQHVEAGTVVVVGGPEMAGELDQLVSDTRVLGDIVSDLLLSAQLDQATPVGEEVDLAGLAQDVVASMGAYAAEHGVALRAEVGHGGTDTDADAACVVLGAPTALRRAVSALVDNAVAHSPRGESILLHVRREGEDVRLSVEDHGDGLDPLDAARLVERFARGSTSGGGRRFGLGLSLVDEIVRAHRGRLDIDGAPGAGSTFSLVLRAAGRT
ncbi:MAG: HAMP domain-containing sensor histidine kinase, partial [Lapillicoccus sp.]